MRGRKKTHVIKLAQTAVVQLQQIVTVHKWPHSEVQRAKILLLCERYPDWTDAQVASAVACSIGLVRKWRKRWSEDHSVQDAPRRGRPRRLPLV